MEPLSSAASAKPLVSVVMPARTGIRWLPHALESICRQKYSEVEVILVDDCSGEDLQSVASRFPLNVSVHRLEKPSGVAAARNYGINHSCGAFVAFLDVDDLWEDNHLNRHTEILMAAPDALGSRGHTASFYSAGELKPLSIARNYTPFHLGASLFRRRIFELVGLFDESMSLSSDADFYFRCRHAQAHIVDDSTISLYYRKSEQSLSRSREEPRRMLRGLAQALRARNSREQSV